MSDQTDQRASKRARIGPSKPLVFQFSFLNTLLKPLLQDVDVLSRLIITSKSAKTWIGQYALKKSLTFEQALLLAYDDRMSYITIERIRGVDSADLSHFPDLRSLQFHWTFNQPIPIGSLPNRLKSLDFGDSFYQPIEVGALPQSLVSVDIGKMFNHPLVPGAIPSCVERLSFSKYSQFNQPLVPGSLPSALQQIAFYSYNHPLVPGVIPEGVETIHFKGSFNHPLAPGVFPESVTEISFYCSEYDYPFYPGVLPSNLKSFSMSEGYNQSAVVTRCSSAKLSQTIAGWEILSSSLQK